MGPPGRGGGRSFGGRGGGGRGRGGGGRGGGGRSFREEGPPAEIVGTLLLLRHRDSLGDLYRILIIFPLFLS